jgi:hypothetical protein
MMEATAEPEGRKMIERESRAFALSDVHRGDTVHIHALLMIPFLPMPFESLASDRYQTVVAARFAAAHTRVVVLLMRERYNDVSPES